MQLPKSIRALLWFISCRLFKRGRLNESRVDPKPSQLRRGASTPAFVSCSTPGEGPGGGPSRSWWGREPLGKLSCQKRGQNRVKPGKSPLFPTPFFMRRPTLRARVQNVQSLSCLNVLDLKPRADLAKGKPHMNPLQCRLCTLR